MFGKQATMTIKEVRRWVRKADAVLVSVPYAEPGRLVTGAWEFAVTKREARAFCSAMADTSRVFAQVEEYEAGTRNLFIGPLVVKK